MAAKDYRETVRKLLAKAEDPGCSPAEAEALTERAMLIMAKHGIDQAMIDAGRDAGTAESDPVDEFVFTVPAQFARDALNLLSRICASLEAELVLINKETAGHVFAPRSTLERIDTLFTSLLIQCAMAMARETVPWGTTVHAFRTGFYAGFAGRIGERLAEIEKRARTQAASAVGTDGPSVALVLANRSDIAKAKLRTAYPSLGHSTYRRGTAGRDQGRAAGSRADLGQGRVGQGRQAVTSG